MLQQTPLNSKDLSHLFTTSVSTYSTQRGPVTFHLASYLLGIGDVPLRVNRTKCAVYRSPPFGAGVSIAWRYDATIS
jgi:hypothetical protein